MLKSYRYRLYPNKNQAELLDKHFGCVRFVYNMGLQKKKEVYQLTGKSISCFDLTTKIMVPMKHDGEHEWLNEVSSQSLIMALRNLDNAYTNFFRGITKFPQFKKKHGSRQSCQFPLSVRVNYERKIIKLPIVGEIKVVFDRIFEGKIKTTTVSKTPTDKYFVSILVEDGKKLPVKPKKVDAEKTIGVDLGLKRFAVLSNGEKVENPKFLKKDINRLKVLHRRASHKKKGSQNRKKANLKIARIHERIKNRRKDFLHKLSAKLVSENQAICFEDLNIEGMMQNHSLAQSIGDISWSTFVNFCQYKADWAGKNILKIGQFDPSSKTCSVCGWMKTDLKLSDREWECGCCHTVHDRDINAAINIKQMALIRFGKYENYTGPGRPEEPMETPGYKQGL
jgi:putative transposase